MTSLNPTGCACRGEGKHYTFHSPESCGVEPVASQPGEIPYSRMADAIRGFRNLNMLKNLTKLRATLEYAELCSAWEEYDDSLPKAMRKGIMGGDDE